MYTMPADYDVWVTGHWGEDAVHELRACPRCGATEEDAVEDGPFNIRCLVCGCRYGTDDVEHDDWDDYDE